MSSLPTTAADADPDGVGIEPERTGQRKWWIIGITGCLLATAVVIWFGLSATLGKVSWTTVGYKVVDAKTVELTFDVDRPVGSAAICTVRALAADFATVGSVDVPIPVSTERVTVNHATIRTTSLAVTGVVQFCRKA